MMNDFVVNGKPSLDNLPKKKALGWLWPYLQIFGNARWGQTL
jgi:hypothetical protein